MVFFARVLRNLSSRRTPTSRQPSTSKQSRPRSDCPTYRTVALFISTAWTSLRRPPSRSSQSSKLSFVSRSRNQRFWAASHHYQINVRNGTPTNPEALGMQPEYRISSGPQPAVGTTYDQRVSLCCLKTLRRDSQRYSYKRPGLL